MATGASFPLFTRRHSGVPLSRPIQRSHGRKKRIMFWRRGEATIFQKCLAIYMYYAKKPEPRASDMG